MAMMSSAKPMPQKGHPDPVKGYRTYLAIRGWLTSQGLGGFLALAGFAAIWVVGYPDWLRVSVAEGLVMGAFFAGSALFLGMVNWRYMGREMGRRLEAAGLDRPQPLPGRLWPRLIFLAICVGICAVSLLGEYAMQGGLAAWRAEARPNHPFFRMPSMAGFWATLGAVALMHALLRPRRKGVERGNV